MKIIKVNTKVFGKKIKKRISSEKERVLNPIVERHRMCGRNSVGQVSELILTKGFNSKKEWENFYFKSGKKRRKFIEQKLKEISKTKLKQLISKQKINKIYGRTKEDLEEKAKQLFGRVPKQIKRLEKNIKTLKKIEEKDCIDCIEQYVIDNTWEGIMKREEAVVKKLIKHGIEPKNIKKTSGDVDTKLGVDREIFSEDGKKKVGLQIKPDSSRGGPLIDAHNKAAQAKYEGRVITIFSNTKGKIRNEEKVIKEIKKEINLKN